MTESGPRRGGRWRRGVGSPAVVFLDDLRWDAFTQLAPRLRRAGIRTIRITTETHGRSRLTSRLLFDRWAVLDPDGDDHDLRRILAEERVVDLQFVETLSDLVRRNLGALAPEVAQRVRTRLEIMDKFAAARTFAAAGVRTPEVLDATSTSPEAAAEELGLPTVAKKRIGCGGDNVVIAADLDALRTASSSWGGDASERYYERFVRGDKLNYAAVKSSSRIEQELAYRVSRWMQPVGTATEIETIDEPGLVAFGRRAVEVSGCTGLMNLDVIRDANGAYWLIDFNARAFGGGANFLTVGVDVSEGYLVSLGYRQDPPGSRTAPAQSRIDVFPTSLGDPRNGGSVVRMALAFLGDSLPYLRRLGVRYWLSELLRAPDAAAASRRWRGATRIEATV